MASKYDENVSIHVFLLGRESIWFTFCMILLYFHGCCSLIKRWIMQGILKLFVWSLKAPLASIIFACAVTWHWLNFQRKSVDFLPTFGKLGDCSSCFVSLVWGSGWNKLWNMSPWFSWLNCAWWSTTGNIMKYQGKEYDKDFVWIICTAPASIVKETTELKGWRSLSEKLEWTKWIWNNPL